MKEARRCIYCTIEKPVAAFSAEHIIPQFMGGSSDKPEVVTTEVCRSCNSLFGRHVDAAVAKGYFINSVELGSWKGCFDYNKEHGNVYPLIYFGKNAEINFGNNEDVEVWLAPDGGTAWHIHAKSDDNFDTFVGGDPVVRRLDESSRVYAFIASQHPYWALSNLKSVKKHFYEEPIFLGTDSDLELEFSKARQPGSFCQKNDDALAERDKLRTLLDRGGQLKNTLQMDLLFDVRFLAKIAIAFGFKMFSNEFGQLDYTNRLRTLLWTRRQNLETNQTQIQMKTYFAGVQDVVMKSINFQFGFVFLFKVVGKSLVLCIVFPSGRSVQVTIINEIVDPRFNLLQRWKRDIVFISIPQLKRTVGPLDFAEYLSWKLGKMRIASLDHIRARITLREQMPPLHGGYNA